MKNFTYIFVFLSLNLFAQSKYITKTGTVNFEASVNSFEEVKASNSSTTAIIDSDNGKFAALVLVKGFRFKNALMEEHFNENYAESDTYPKATFKGNIVNFSLESINSKEFKINGQLTFHGKTKQLNNIIVKLSKKGNTIIMSGNFETIAEDFDIKIPKIVSSKIAKTIEISFYFELQKK